MLYNIIHTDSIHKNHASSGSFRSHLSCEIGGYITLKTTWFYAKPDDHNDIQLYPTIPPIISQYHPMFRRVGYDQIIQSSPWYINSLPEGNIDMSPLMYLSYPGSDMVHFIWLVSLSYTSNKNQDNHNE